MLLLCIPDQCPHLCPCLHPSPMTLCPFEGHLSPSLSRWSGSHRTRICEWNSVSSEGSHGACAQTRGVLSDQTSWTSHNAAGKVSQENAASLCSSLRKQRLGGSCCCAVSRNSKHVKLMGSGHIKAVMPKARGLRVSSARRLGWCRLLCPLGSTPPRGDQSCSGQPRASGGAWAPRHLHGEHRDS